MNLRETPQIDRSNESLDHNGTKISMKFLQNFFVWFMSFGQSVKCQNWCRMLDIYYCYLLKLWPSFTIWGASMWYYKGALTQKRSWYDFHVGWKNQNKYSTLNLSFDALSKWHEPDINLANAEGSTYKELTNWSLIFFVF